MYVSLCLHGVDLHIYIYIRLYLIQYAWRVDVNCIECTLHYTKIGTVKIYKTKCILIRLIVI